MSDGIGPSRFEGVFTDGERLYTRNSTPGQAVYGERLVAAGGEHYREWVPTRSKLAAYIRSGGNYFPFRRASRVLYLGAASGTTASHVADIVTDGTVYCVEFSPRSFRDLVPVCEGRPNMVPFLADATRPHEYAFGITVVDVVYQDIAQKGQVRIFLKNLREFRAERGMVVIKSRSENVAQDPEVTYRQAADELVQAGLVVRAMVRLDPMEKDHAIIGVER
jgi:fibrillarin-like pre-rRNA processing protein